MSLVSAVIICQTGAFHELQIQRQVVERLSLLAGAAAAAGTLKLIGSILKFVAQWMFNDCVASFEGIPKIQHLRYTCSCHCSLVCVSSRFCVKGDDLLRARRICLRLRDSYEGVVKAPR